MVRLRSIGLVGLTLLAILTRDYVGRKRAIPAGESLIDALARTQPGDHLLSGPATSGARTDHGARHYARGPVGCRH